MQTDISAITQRWGTAIDPHCKWWREAQALWDEAGRVESDDERGALLDQAYALHEQIAEAPAISPAAIACQLRVAMLALDGEIALDTGKAAAELALASLLAMGPSPESVVR